MGPIRWVPKKQFFKNLIFIVDIRILIRDFWVIFKNYSMRMLSIRGNDFIAHWAYEEMILSHTEHTPNEFLRMFSQRKNVNSFYMYSYAEHTGKWYYRTLSIRGNDFIAPWAYKEIMLSHPEHRRKCLKVEYVINWRLFVKSPLYINWELRLVVPSFQYFYLI